MLFSYDGVMAKYREVRFGNGYVSLCFIACGYGEVMWCVFWLGHGLVRFCLMMSGTYGNGVVSCNEVWIRNGVVGICCGEVMVW